MIAVVGGGITGLLLGHELEREGLDYELLEATDRAGGVIRSGRVEGRILDWGPQRLRLTAAIRELVGELGLEDELLHAPDGLGIQIYRRGELSRVPTTAREFLTSDLVGWGARLRLLLEPLTPGPDPDERVAHFFRRKLGNELYETLVAPLYGGLYASDPEEMRVGTSLLHALAEFGIGRSLLLPLLRRGGRIHPPPAVTFREGMEALPRALARRLGERLRTGSPVRGIEADGGSWRVEFEGGVVVASRVVLTTPAPVTARLLAEVAPDAAARIGALRYNPLAVVHLHSEAPLRGLGFQVAFTEDRVLRGVTFNASLFGRKDLYTAYLGGARHPEVAEMSDEELGATAVREFELCTGHRARPLSVEHERMPAWDLSWDGLAENLSLPEGVLLAANWWTRPGLPGRVAEAKRLAARLTASAPRPR